MERFYIAPEKEYEKNGKQLRKEDVENLGRWAEKQAHLPKMCESQLIAFLQSCYYSQETAKSAIENYFTLRTHTPEVFLDFHSLNPLRKTAEIMLVAPLKGKTKEGYDVLFARLLDPNAENYIFSQGLTVFDMVCTLALAQHGTGLGHVLIADPEGFSLSHLFRMNPLLAKKFIVYLQDALPIRVKAIHVVNAHPIVDKLLSMFRHLIKDDIFDLIHIHTKIEEFYEEIPKDILPNELGGEAGTYKELQSESMANLEANEAFFEAHNLQIVDETKRLHALDYATDSFVGSFKKLDLD